MSSQDRVVAGSSDRHQAVEVVVGWSALSLEPSADGTGMDAEGTGHVPPPPLAVDRLADFADSGDNLHIDGVGTHGRACFVSFGRHFGRGPIDSMSRSLADSSLGTDD